MKFIESARHHEKGFRIWKVSNTFTGAKSGFVKGKLVLAVIDDVNVSSLKLTFPTYGKSNGKEYNHPTQATYSFKIRNNKIYFYVKRKLEGGLTEVRDKTVHIRKYLSDKFLHRVYSKITGPRKFSQLEWECLEIREFSRDIEYSDVPNKAAIRRFVQLFNYWLKLNNFPRKFKLLKDESLSESLTQFIYPSLKTLGVREPIEGLPILKENAGVKQIIKKAFGYDSKKITKLVCGKIQKKNNLEWFKTGLALKGLIPLDKFYPVLEKESPFDERLKPIVIRTFFKERSESVRLKLIESWSKERDYIHTIFNDTFKMYSQCRDHIAEIPKDVEKDWSRFHDWLSVEQRKIKNPPVPIKYSDKELELDGAAVDDLEIELPKDTYKLIEWGQALSHCVGSYGWQASNKQCKILGVKKAGEIKYCIEVRNNEIVQFRGKYNCAPEKDDHSKIIELLKKKQIKELVF